MATRGRPDPNSALYMSTNRGLYQFWLMAEYRRCVYYLPEARAYLVARVEGTRLCIQQVFGPQRVEPARLAAAFGQPVEELVFGYTPAHTGGLLVREHKEEDTTLFVLGDELRRIERDRLRFPALSHA